MEASVAALGRLLPFGVKTEGTVDDINNCFHYDPLLSSSGQPNKHHFVWIQEAGYELVINLALYDLLELRKKVKRRLWRHWGWNIFIFRWIL